MLSNYDTETLRINHSIRLEPEIERRKAEADAHAAQIKAAVESLQRAVAADKQAGLADSAALRDVRPVRPKILDQSAEWDWDAAKIAKFNEAQNKARGEYYEHLILAAPNLLSPEMMRELPGAIRFCAGQVAAAEQAAQQQGK